MTQYLILGTGVAGRRAAETILGREKGAQITLVDETKNPFFYKPLLGESIARGPKYVHMADAHKRAFDRKGIRLVTGVKITSLNSARQEVVCSNGMSLGYDRLLIALGSKTVRPPWDNGTISGIAYLDTLNDAQGILSVLSTVRMAIVYGSSIQAIDALRGLRGRGIECTCLLDGERFWPGILDPVASEIVEARLRQEGITVLTQSRIQDLLTGNGKLKGVVTTKGEKILADLLVVAAPQAAVLDFLQSGGLTVDRGLVVDESLRTNRENIFAAGDVAQPLLAATKDHAPQPGWLNAWRQGTCAGLNMSGELASYKGVPSTRTKVLDLDLVCLGLSDVKGKGIRDESGDFPYAELPYVYKKLVYKDEKVAGALFVGDVGEAGHVERWVREGIASDQCDSSLINQMFNVRLPKTATLGALCPVCKFQIQVEETHREGDIVTCPACGVDFRLKRMPNGVFRAEPVMG